MTLVSGTTYDLVPTEGTITNPGTPNTASRMNNIESGIDAVTNEVIAHEADVTKHIPYKISTNVGNAYSVTIAEPAGVVAYYDGMPLCVKFNATSTGAITVNANTWGAKNVVDQNGNNVTNVKANSIWNLRYEAVNGNFQLQGSGGGNGTEDFEYGLNPFTGGIF
jgi:hypothetical protein